MANASHPCACPSLAEMAQQGLPVDSVRLSCSAATLGTELGFSEIVQFAPSSTNDCSRLGTEDMLRVPGADAVAVSIQDHHLEPYGHVFPIVYAFFCHLVLYRARHQSPEKLQLFLPAGLHLHGIEREPQRRSLAARAFEEIEGLFDGPAFGLRIRRVPWVPYCRQAGRLASGRVECCVAAERVPWALRRQYIALLAGFPGFSRPIHTLGGMGRELFRWSERRRSTGMQLPAAQHPRANLTTVTWLLSSKGSNERRLANEEALVSATAAWLAQHQPSVRLRALHVQEMTYASQLQALADTDVLIALFGSGLHNCRLLPPGSVVVQLHGALKQDRGDHFLYHSVCEHEFGHHWAPLATPHSIHRYNLSDPMRQADWLWRTGDGRWVNQRMPSCRRVSAQKRGSGVQSTEAEVTAVCKGSPTTYNTAWLSEALLLRFFDRVWRKEWAGLQVDFRDTLFRDARCDALPNPDHRSTDLMGCHRLRRWTSDGPNT